MVELRVQRREADSTKCPYCLDTVQVGATCGACAARYHTECATTFGRCATRGCVGTFEGVVALVQALPRLGSMARRIGTWRVNLEGAADSWVIVLEPTPPGIDLKAASEAVGEVLGHSAYDGRMRLGSSYPEPLVRVGSREHLDMLLGRLRGVGVDVLELPLPEVIRPLGAFLVRDVVSIDPLRVRGQATVLGDKLKVGELVERDVVGVPLVIPAFINTVRRQTSRMLAGMSSEPGGGGRKIFSRPSDKAERERALFIYLDGEPDPIVIRSGRLRHAGLEVLGAQRTGSTVQNMNLLAEEVSRRVGTVRPMCQTVVHNTALLTYLDALGNVRSSIKSVGLVARLMRHAWDRDRREGRPEPERTPTKPLPPGDNADERFLRAYRELRGRSLQGKRKKRRTKRKRGGWFGLGG